MKYNVTNSEWVKLHDLFARGVGLCLHLFIVNKRHATGLSTCTCTLTKHYVKFQIG